MLYYGERKKGCRFLEVTLHGYRTLILENDLMRVMLLIDKGTDIFSYVHKKTDTDVIWTNPMGLSCLAKRRSAIMDDDCYTDNYLGAMFEILPNFGSTCVYQNVHLPGHSEVSSLPWDMQVVEDSAERVVLKFTVKLSKMPLMLTKTLTVTNGSTALCFDETLTNIGYVAVPYLWAQHPCIGQPFLNEDCVYELPFREDISMPAPGKPERHFQIYPSGEQNFAAIRNQKTGLGVGFAFDPAEFSHCAVWVKPDSGIGHHKWDGFYVASILPCNCEMTTLSEAAAKGVAPVIEPGETKTAWYTMCLFEQATRVQKVHRDGSVE